MRNAHNAIMHRTSTHQCRNFPPAGSSYAQATLGPVPTPAPVPVSRSTARQACVAAQVGAMRRRGMSETAIRRALGLDPRAAAAAGIGSSVPLGSAPAPRAPGRAGPRMMEVLTAVARVAEVETAAVLGPAQDRRHARARQLTMHLLRELCAGASLPTIGYFLHRDHTTVLYGLRRAAFLLRRDAGFRALRDRARAALSAGEGG